MPIQKSAKDSYPENWSEISHYIRFERAKGKCEKCGRPNMEWILSLPDGRWTNPAEKPSIWRNDDGEQVRPPPHAEQQLALNKRYVTAAAHIDHDRSNNDESNLAAWCNRCHIHHDKPEQWKSRRHSQHLKKLKSQASGDLFFGDYPGEDDPAFRRSPTS